MSDAQAQMANDLFTVRLESRGVGEPRPVLWMKLLVGAALFLVSLGLVDWVPKSYVRVLDRRTGDVVVEHVWRHMRYAEEDLLEIQHDLKSLSIQEFQERHDFSMPS